MIIEDLELHILIMISSMTIIFITTVRMIELKKMNLLLPFILIGVAFGIIPAFAFAGVIIPGEALLLNILAIVSAFWILIILRRENGYSN